MLHYRTAGPAIRTCLKFSMWKTNSLQSSVIIVYTRAFFFPLYHRLLWCCSIQTIPAECLNGHHGWSLFDFQLSFSKRISQFCTRWKKISTILILDQISRAIWGIYGWRPLAGSTKDRSSVSDRRTWVPPTLLDHHG